MNGIQFVKIVKTVQILDSWSEMCSGETAVTSSCASDDNDNVLYSDNYTRLHPQCEMAS